MSIYVPYHADWHNRSEATDTPITAEFLEYLEAGLVDASTKAYSAYTLAGAAIPDPAAAVDQVPVWNGTSWVAQKITDSQISATAGISISKFAGYPNDSTKYLRGDGTWVTISVPTTNTQKYTTTLGGAITSGVETDVLSWSVPASDLTDGDYLEITFGYDLANSSGSNKAITFKFYYGAASITFTAFNSVNGAGTVHHLVTVRAIRAGSDLWIADPSTRAAGEDFTAGQTNAQVISGAAFSSLSTVKLTATVASGSASNSLTPKVGRAYRLN